MFGGLKAGWGRALAVFLIGLLLAMSAAPCMAAAPVVGPSAAAFDPCHETQAPAPECAQIACKTFAVPAAPALPMRAPAVVPPSDRRIETAAGRLVRPPLPPPRASMI